MRESGGLPVNGELSHLMLDGLSGSVNPADVPVTRHAHVDERAECLLVNAAVSMAYDGAVDLGGDYERQRRSCDSERLLDMGGVEQAECDIQCFPEAAVGVVADFSCVHDDADPQLPLWLGVGNVRVVVNQEPAESGDNTIEQQHLRRLVHGPDEREDAVAAVDERVTIASVDSRGAQCFVEQLVYLAAQLRFDRIRSAGGLLDIERDDRPVTRQIDCLERFRLASIH